MLNDIILQKLTLDDEVANGAIHMQGDADAVRGLVSPLDVFDFWFNIVTP